MKHYRDAGNKYLGNYSDELTPPEGAVEISSAPTDSSMRWNGSAWALLSYADYQSINTYAGWLEYCRAYGKDYKFFREVLGSQMLPAWESLSADDKKACVKVYKYPITFTQQDIDALFTADEQLANWQAIVLFSVQSRHDRWYAAARTLSFYLTEAESFDLYVTTLPLTEQFIDIGSPALYLWLTNGSYPSLGIDYTTNGFAQKTYYSEDRKNLATDIIVNGNYSATQLLNP